MRNLITGGAGFIGSWLAGRLLDLGQEVVIVDDLSTGDVANIPEGSIYPGPLDLLVDEKQIAKYAATCDRIYHLAGVVGVDNVVQNANRTRAVNVAGTKLILRLAERYATQVLVTSSSEVYGDLTGALREDIATEITSCLTAYGTTKWEAEKLAMDSYYRQRSPLVIVRLFNVIGPRQSWRYGMVVPRFVKQAQQGLDITVFGSGNQCRSFTDVRDAVSAMIALMSEVRAMGQTINVGSDKCTRIRELAIMIKAVTGSSSRIVHIPYHHTIRATYVDPPVRIPDLSKARRLIGYRTKYSLENTINDVATYISTSLRYPDDSMRSGCCP